MGEIVLELQNIVQILNQKEVPIWLTYLSAIGPLILTILTAFWAWRQHKQSQILQKVIHNREVRLQSRENILQIYNYFCAARKHAGVSILSLGDTFSREQTMQELADKTTEISRLLYQSWQQGKLFFRKSDPEFVDVLYEHYDKYLLFCESVVYYISLGEAKDAIETAWNETKCRFKIENKIELNQNSKARIHFIELCYTDKVKRVAELGREFVDNMSYDKFDQFFEKYLQIDELV